MNIKYSANVALKKNNKLTRYGEKIKKKNIIWDKLYT